MLAQKLEEAGLSTVTVTMMPFWTKKLGTPRTLGVEVPFGHAFGVPGDREMQMSIIRAALSLLEEAREPGAAGEAPDDAGDRQTMSTARLRRPAVSVPGGG